MTAGEGTWEVPLQRNPFWQVLSTCRFRQEKSTREAEQGGMEALARLEANLHSAEEPPKKEAQVPRKHSPEALVCSDGQGNTLT